MVERLARFLVRRPVAWTVVIVTALIGIVAGILAIDVQQDDDVLAFLPPANPQIRAFREINETFGATDVALVGLDVDDPFDPATVEKLQGLTTQLRDTPGLNAALTLTNVSDFVTDPDGGIVTSTLIDAVPANAAAREALRAKVMSRDHIVGTLISEDAGAILVLAFATPGQQPRDVARAVRGAVEQWFPDTPTYWGGAPFISTWIYETTQADMAALTPWAILVIVFVMLVAFRDWLGTLLGLMATGVGIAVSRAAMWVLDVSFNIVLSSMPIILFAVGSAYAIHILSRYDHHAREVGPSPEAVVRTLVGTGPTVVAAGLTTVAGLSSFVVMDIQPMRVFGVFTALGLLVALITSLTFVPALMALFPRPVRPVSSGRWQELMEKLAVATRTHQPIVAVVLLAVCGLGLTSAGAVEARMDLAAFFNQDTEPDVAQDFLDEHFGGSQFLQIHVQGDLEQPGVLREIGRISDRIRRLPHVSDVQGIDRVIELVNDAMSGARRVPDTRGQAAVLFRFGSSDTAASQLVTDDRTQALLQVRIDDSDADVLDAVLADVRTLVAEEAVDRYRIATRRDDADGVEARLHDVITERVLTLGHDFDVPLPDDATAVIGAFLRSRPPAAPPDHVREALERFLTGEENFAPVTPEQARVVAEATAALGPGVGPDTLEQALSEALEVPPDDMLVQDLLVSMDAPLHDAWRTASARAGAEALLDRLGAEVPDTPSGERFLAAVASKLQDRDAPDALLAAEGQDAAPLAWTVSGMPVLYQGLSQSVTANQFKSLGMALGLVLLIMTVYYRSLFTGMLATAPTFVTLALVYGGMGAMGVHLDIGTSMLASIIIGAGVDYAVHLLAGWHAPPGGEIVDAARHAVRETSHAIWTNAIMVAGGFFVLTLGDAKPLQNVGGLTAAAMLVAALATFVVLPLLANKRHYRQHTG